MPAVALGFRQKKRFVAAPRRAARHCEPIIRFMDASAAHHGHPFPFARNGVRPRFTHLGAARAVPTGIHIRMAVAADLLSATIPTMFHYCDMTVGGQAGLPATRRPNAAICHSCFPIPTKHLTGAPRNPQSVRQHRRASFRRGHFTFAAVQHSTLSKHFGASTFATCRNNGAVSSSVVCYHIFETLNSR